MDPVAWAGTLSCTLAPCPQACTPSSGPHQKNQLVPSTAGLWSARAPAEALSAALGLVTCRRTMCCVSVTRLCQRGEWGGGKVPGRQSVLEERRGQGLAGPGSGLRENDLPTATWVGQNQGSWHLQGPSLRGRSHPALPLTRPRALTHQSPGFLGV